MDMKKIIDMMVKNEEGIKQEFSDQLAAMVQQKVYGEQEVDDQNKKNGEKQEQEETK